MSPESTDLRTPVTEVQGTPETVDPALHTEMPVEAILDASKPVEAAQAAANKEVVTHIVPIPRLAEIQNSTGGTPPENGESQEGDGQEPTPEIEAGGAGSGDEPPAELAAGGEEDDEPDRLAELIRGGIPLTAEEQAAIDREIARRFWEYTGTRPDDGADIEETAETPDESPPEDGGEPPQGGSLAEQSYRDLGRVFGRQATESLDDPVPESEGERGNPLSEDMPGLPSRAAEEAASSRDEAREAQATSETGDTPAPADPLSGQVSDSLAWEGPAPSFEEQARRIPELPMEEPGEIQDAEVTEGREQERTSDLSPAQYAGRLGVIVDEDVPLPPNIEELAALWNESYPEPDLDPSTIPMSISPSGGLTIDIAEYPLHAFRISRAVSLANAEAGEIGAIYEMRAQPDRTEPPIVSTVPIDLGDIFTRLTYTDHEHLRRIWQITSILQRIDRQGYNNT